MSTGSSGFYAFDMQGNTRLMTDSTGTVTDRYVYNAFGEEIAAMGKNTPHRFGGQVGYYSDSAGRLFVRARHLNPQTGRWISKDPIGFFGGYNLYGYVGNMPTTRNDPSGLATVQVYYIQVDKGFITLGYHAAIRITDDVTGMQYSIAAFPASSSDPIGLLDGKFAIVGSIRHGPTFPGEHPMPIIQTIVHRDGKPAVFYLLSARKRLRQINAAHFKYEAARQNSNTTARDLLLHMGLRPPIPPYKTPAWGNTLTDKM